MKNIILLILFLLLNITSIAKEKSQNYSRVISMSLASDEIIYELIDSNRILGLSGHSSNNKMVSNLYGKIDNYKKIDNNIEMIIELGPDLVIAPEWLKKSMIKQLEDAGINVYIYKIPRTFEQEKKLIMELASLLGVEEKGKSIVKNMNFRYEELQKKIDKNKKPKILEWSHFGTTNGIGTIFNDMICNIYGVNLASEFGIEGSKNISKEKVIEINPDIIIVPCWDNVDINKDSEKILNFIKNDPSLQDIEAVKNNQVYILPGKYIYVYSQYIINAMEELAKLIYNID